MLLPGVHRRKRRRLRGLSAKSDECGFLGEIVHQEIVHRWRIKNLLIKCLPSSYHGCMKLNNKLLQEGPSLNGKTWNEREDSRDSMLVNASECAKNHGPIFSDGLPAICYLPENNRYYFFNDHSKMWQRSTKGDIKVRLVQLGYDPIPTLLRLQAEHVIDDVYEKSAECSAGIHFQNGKRILVMSGKGEV